MSRALVVFPGRGSYGPGSLGSLPPQHPWVRRADELRVAEGLTPLSALDASERFDPGIHLRPTNAWPLILLCGLLDAERIADDNEVVAVTASSTGWFTALAASGALGFDDAMRLAQEMARAAEAPLRNGDRAAEIIYPLTDDAWRPDEGVVERVATTLAAASDAHLAVDLGAFAVIGGLDDAVETVRLRLQPVTIGNRTYPMRLAAADGWHTPLRASAVAGAAARLGELSWERPNVTLIDGRGYRFTPWSTDPGELAAATLTGQGQATYDFAAGMGVALRDYAPDVVLLAGPGGSLGAACAQLVVMEGYRGLRTRADLEATQAGPSPLLLSLRR
jgi:hypothetical protein